MDIESLNSELRRELGVKPLYGWRHGSDLFVVLPELDSEGKVKYDIGMIAGSKVLGTKVKAKKVYYSELYELVRPGLQLGTRWVFSRLYIPEFSPDEWNRMFSGMVPWASQIWLPVDWSGGRAVGGHLMTDPYQPVTPELQARAIGVTKANKRFREQINRRQMLDAMYDDRDAREARIQTMGERAAAMAPVGGWTRVPGEKSDMVLFNGKPEEPVK